MSGDDPHAPSGSSLMPPSGEELAAVIAAAEVAWPRPVAAAEPDDGQPAWRFSGRWWARPVAARRQRPRVG